MTKRNLQGYSRINADQAYDTIGQNIVNQIKSISASEIRYRKVGQVTYETLVSATNTDERPVKNMVVIDATPVNGLESIFKANLYNPRNLPAEIRVIRPNVHRDLYVVFFSAEKK